MAVAVKNAPETSSPSLLDRLPVQCFLGTLYVLASIVIIMQGLAALWWHYLGMEPTSLLACAALVVLRLVVAGGLAYLAYLLLGPRPTPGVKAGTFVGLVAVGIALLLAWWASIWFQHWSLDRSLFPRSVAIGLSVAVLIGLLGLVGWAFFRPEVQKRIVQFEELGWFNLSGYKASQGLKVRRGTILGVLIILLSGTWVLHRSIQTDAWSAAIPFTGTVLITDPGDAAVVLDKLNEAQKDRVGIITPGDWKEVQQKGQILSRAAYDESVDRFRDAIKVTDKGDAQFEGDVVLNSKPLIVTRAAFDAAKEQLAKEGGKQPEGTAPKMPEVGPALDPYVLRDVNNRLKAEYVRVAKRGKNSRLDEGQVVPVSEFEEERARVEERVKQQDEIRRKLDKARELREKGEDDSEELAAVNKAIEDALPTAAPDGPEPATGETEYRRVTLLPTVKYTLPVILVAAALWFAWRLVNMPAFADFLIATEAELNKVSWTTRRRLVQDTIVVLVTVVLMTAFLLFADVIWSQSLRWVGVLHPGAPPESTTQQEVPW